MIIRGGQPIGLYGFWPGHLMGCSGSWAIEIPTAWDSFVSMARSPFISRSMLCYLPGYSFTGSMACVLHSRGLA